MNKGVLVVACLLLLLPIAAGAQNIVTVARVVRGTSRGAVIARDIRTTRSLVTLSREASIRKLPQAYAMTQQVNSVKLSRAVEVQVKTTILEKALKSPSTVYGPYNYVRAFSRVAKEVYTVNPKFVSEWKHINNTTTYNGVHHLVSKGVLEQIGYDMQVAGIKVNIKDMQFNAPSLYTKFHGDPRYAALLHDIKTQYSVYNAKGMKELVTLQMDLIDRIADIEGAEKIPLFVRSGLIKETELWCSQFNLRF